MRLVHLWSARAKHVVIMRLSSYTLPRRTAYFHIKLVASFRSRRSFSLGPRWRATASYESGAIRKMVGLRGRLGAGIRVIAAFFGPYAPEALIAHVSVFSHDFKRFK